MIDRDGNGIDDRVDLYGIAVAAMTARGLLHELPAVPPAEPAGNDGRDLTDLPWNSIDNASSRDLDQVEYAERHEGFTRVLVGIAEVSVFTPPGSALDLAAAHNAATVYTAAGVFPMIPRALSEGRTSLLDGQARRAMVTALDIADDGAVLRSERPPSSAKGHRAARHNARPEGWPPNERGPWHRAEGDRQQLVVDLI